MRRVTRGVYICTFVVEASDEWEQMFSKGSQQLDATRYTAYVVRPAAPPPRHRIHRLTQIDSTEKNTIMFAGRSLLTNRHIINSIPLCVVREEVCCTRSLSARDRCVFTVTVLWNCRASPTPARNICSFSQNTPIVWYRCLRPLCYFNPLAQISERKMPNRCRKQVLICDDWLVDQQLVSFFASWDVWGGCRGFFAAIPRVTTGGQFLSQVFLTTLVSYITYFCTRSFKSPCLRFSDS